MNLRRVISIALVLLAGSAFAAWAAGQGDAAVTGLAHQLPSRLEFLSRRRGCYQ
mgnify:CR=1 FL=1